MGSLILSYGLTCAYRLDHNSIGDERAQHMAAALAL
jgi:hypothetical protein